MTEPEVEAFLRDHETVIVPDRLDRAARPARPAPDRRDRPDRGRPARGAERSAPLVAPDRSTTRCRTRTSGSPGVVHIRIPTFMALIEDLCASLASIGFRRIVFLNGHYDNTYAIAYACANAAERLPAGVARLPGQLLGRHDRRGGGRVLRPDDRPPREPRRDVGGDGHRPATSSTSTRANAEMPPFPEVTNQAPVHTAFFFSAPGSVHRATQSGTWGDAREASVEYGERYLEVVTDGDGPDARRHRADVRGDAAALTASVADDPAPAAHHAADREVRVELDEVGPLADGDPAAVRDAEQRQRVAARGGDRGRQRRARRPRRCGPRRRGRCTEPARVVVPASVTRSPTTSTSSAADPPAPVARPGERPRRR